MKKKKHVAKRKKPMNLNKAIFTQDWDSLSKDELVALMRIKSAMYEELTEKRLKLNTPSGQMIAKHRMLSMVAKGELILEDTGLTLEDLCI